MSYAKAFTSHVSIMHPISNLFVVTVTVLKMCYTNTLSISEKNKKILKSNVLSIIMPQITKCPSNIFTCSLPLLKSYFLKDFIYLFLERGEGRERGRDTSMCDCLSHAPNLGPGLQPRHVPQLGIEPATL